MFHSVRLYSCDFWFVWRTRTNSIHENTYKAGWSVNFWFPWKVSYVKWGFSVVHKWKDFLPKQTDTGERTICYSKHMKWHIMFRRNINVTPQTVGTRALLWFVPPCYSLLTTCMYWFTLHHAAHHLWWCHRAKLTKEHHMRFLQLLAASVACC